MKIFSKIFTRLNITIVLLVAQIIIFAILMNRILDLLYLLFGNTHLTRRVRARVKENALAKLLHTGIRLFVKSGWERIFT